MKTNRSYLLRGFFLLLLTATVLLSSAGVYYGAKEGKELSEKESSSKTSQKAPKSKEEKVSASPSFEAVVVSFIAPDFAKEILFSVFEFSPILETVSLNTQNRIVSEKYFRTLFTHFISPNAP